MSWISVRFGKLAVERRWPRRSRAPWETYQPVLVDADTLWTTQNATQNANMRDPPGTPPREPFVGGSVLVVPSRRTRRKCPPLVPSVNSELV